MCCCMPAPGTIASQYGYALLVRIRYSVVMSSLPGESVSCGNLGVISAKKEDAATAKAKATRTAATVE